VGTHALAKRLSIVEITALNPTLPPPQT